MVGVYVADQSAGDLIIFARFPRAEDQFAGAGIPEADAVLRMWVLDRVPDLQAGAIRIDVREVEPVTMTHTCAPEGPPIVIDRDRTVQYLVTTVTVDVAYFDAVL